MDENYRNIGPKALSIPTGHGLTIFLTYPQSEEGDIAGRSIRGLPPAHPIIESLGGVGVVLPPAEMFSSLERGIIDGALFPVAGAVGFAPTASSCNRAYMMPSAISCLNASRR